MRNRKDDGKNSYSKKIATQTYISSQTRQKFGLRSSTITLYFFLLLDTQHSSVCLSGFVDSCDKNWIHSSLLLLLWAIFYTYRPSLCLQWNEFRHLYFVAGTTAAVAGTVHWRIFSSLSFFCFYSFSFLSLFSCIHTLCSSSVLNR